MVLIRFGEDKDWFKANWVFRQLARDVSTVNPADKELNSAMEQAQWFDLRLDEIEGTLAAKIVGAIRQVAELTIEGKIAGWVGTDGADAKGHEMYVDCMEELLELIRTIKAA